MTCNKCGGTGRAFCPACHGTGTMTTTAYGIYETRTISSPCPSCTGTGFRSCSCGSSASVTPSLTPTYETVAFEYDKIVPFKHINGIRPKITSYDAIIDFFGFPDVPIDLNKKSKTFWYEYGFEVCVENGIVDYVTAWLTFKGKTQNGLCIGFDAERAMEICCRDYTKVDIEKEDVWFFKSEHESNLFKINIYAGKINRMAIV